MEKIKKTIRMVIFRLKVRIFFSKMLCQTPARKFMSLTENHLNLIGDKSVLI
jgi:hypothetical protein